jgi:hypothetical protein
MRAEETTPEKMWHQNEPEQRQSRSKSRTKVTNNLVSVAGLNAIEGSEKKRNLPTNISAQQYPSLPSGPGKSKPTKSTVIRHKQPGSAVPGRLFSGQPARKQQENRDYNSLHEELITEILKEEEEVLSQHKSHIDSMYCSTKIVNPSHPASENDRRSRQARKRDNQLYREP